MLPLAIDQLKSQIRGRVARRRRCVMVHPQHEAAGVSSQPQLMAGVALGKWTRRAKGALKWWLHHAAARFLHTTPRQGGAGSAPELCQPDNGRFDLVEADPVVLDACRDGKINLLAVGPLRPEQRHDVMLGAAAAFQRNSSKECRLLIVGQEDPGLPGHAAWVRAQAENLGLGDHVKITGRVSTSALKAYYLVADVFLLTGACPGICRPLLIALALKVPVVAVAPAGPQSYLQAAGLMWEEPDDELLAESIQAIVEDEQLRLGLGWRGWRQWQRLVAADQTSGHFLEAMSTCP